MNQLVIRQIAYEAEAIDITAGRRLCDREGDGVFVFFEPIGPKAGAAFIQITRERPETARAAAACASWSPMLVEVQDNV